MPSVFVFGGEYRLDVARREFRQGGRLVELQPKVFDVLAWLVQHRERAVGRDELIAAVWGKVDVSDNILAQIVGRVRKTVGDSGSRQQCIRTISRYGYRWVAPTEVVEVAADALVQGNPQATGTFAQSTDSREMATALQEAMRGPRWSSPLPLVVLAFTVVVAAVALGAWLWEYGRRAPAQPTSVLVLPVEMPSVAEYAWVRLGVADLLAQCLSAAGQPVVPIDTVAAAARTWRDSQPDSEQLAAFARRSNAGLIVRSRAVFDSGRWRVQLQAWRGSVRTFETSGESPNVLEAARFAFNALAAKLGLHAVAESDELADPHLATTLQQVRASVLFDRLQEARALLDALDPHWQEAPDVLYERGLIDLAEGHPAAALRTFEELAQDANYVADPLRRARVLIALGRARYWKTEFADARRLFSEAISTLESLPEGNNPDLLGRALYHRGTNALQLDDVASAQADYARARALLEGAGDELYLARLDKNYGMMLAYDLDRPEAASTFMAQVADRSALLGDPAGELSARIILSSIYLWMLDGERALSADARMRELETRVAYPPLRQLARLVRAQVLAERGRIREASEILEQERARGEIEHGDPAVRPLMHGLASRIALAGARPALAAQDAEAALKAPLEEADRREYARAWLSLVRARRVLGQQAAAAKAGAAMGNWAEGTGRQLPLLYALVARAELAAGAGEAAQAGQLYEQAEALADSIRIPVDQLEVVCSHADWLLARNDLAAATTVVGRMASWSSHSFEVALLQTRLYHALGDASAWHAALQRARALAGERVIAEALRVAPTRATSMPITAVAGPTSPPEPVVKEQ